MDIGRYGRFVAVAMFFHAAIVATGAAVRLTTSGLGCLDWPGCSETEFVPSWSFHSWIEYGNRLFTTPVALASVAALWATYQLVNRSRATTVLAWWLVLGTVVQALIGAVVVNRLLSPIWVSVHFGVSMTILAAGMALWFSARADAGTITLDPHRGGLAWAAAGAATLVLVTGTVVTGTGPHSGDAEAPRWGYELASVVRVHSVAAWVLCAAVVAVAIKMPRLRPTSGWVLAAVVAQGGIGYWQYFNGVPAGAVFAHVVGATTVWLLVLWQLGQAASAPAIVAPSCWPEPVEAT